MHVNKQKATGDIQMRLLHQAVLCKNTQMFKRLLRRQHTQKEKPWQLHVVQTHMMFYNGTSVTIHWHCTLCCDESEWWLSLLEPHNLPFVFLKSMKVIRVEGEKMTAFFESSVMFHWSFNKHKNTDKTTNAIALSGTEWNVLMKTNISFSVFLCSVKIYMRITHQTCSTGWFYQTT